MKLLLQEFGLFWLIAGMSGLKELSSSDFQQLLAREIPLTCLAISTCGSDTLQFDLEFDFKAQKEWSLSFLCQSFQFCLFLCKEEHAFIFFFFYWATSIMLFEKKGIWWAHSFLTTVLTFRGWLLFPLRDKAARLGDIFSCTWLSNDRALWIKYQKTGDSEPTLTVGNVSHSTQFIGKRTLHFLSKTLVSTPSYRV